MTVYLDVIFLLNILFDACILLIVALIRKQKVRIYRLLIGAVYAASFVFFLLGPYSALFSSPVVKLLFSIGMIWVTFFPFTFRTGLCLLFDLYVVTFSLGGALFGLHYFFGQSLEMRSGALVTRNGGYGDPVTWGFVCILFPILAYLYIKNDQHRKMKKIQDNSIYNCQFDFLNFQIICKGLLDTGNRLVDPLTNRPVVILDVKRFRQALPNDLYEKMIQPNQAVPDFDKVWIKYRLHWIPYRSLGNSNGRLIGMEAVKLKVSNQDETVCFFKVLVAFASEPLHTEAFSCILNPKLWI